MIDIIKAIGVIDLTLIALYAIAIRYTSRALVPSLAFMLTIALSFADMPQDALHAGYAAIYLVLIPLSNIKIATGMLMYAIANAAAVFYFLSPFWLEGFTVYFAIAIVVINLVIIFTITRGAKNGQLADVDRLVIFRVLDLCNLQTYTKTDTRR